MSKNASLLKMSSYRKSYIFIACPWGPKGGGMFKVADYLIQEQSADPSLEVAALVPLDTRGGSNAFVSAYYLIFALGHVIYGAWRGDLVGVHVNMAERLSLFRKSAVILISKAMGIPVVLHLHAAQLPQFYRELPSLIKRFVRWVFSLANTCVVLGTASRAFVIDELGMAAKKVEIVVNGVPEPTKCRKISGTNSTREILFVGNLSERKGVSDLLDALSLLKNENLNIKATFVGGGDLAHYRGRARELDVADIANFAGWLDQDELATLMAGADLLVLPSYDEGLPLVILEALANGVAVVCTPVGEIPNFLSDGENAVFVPPGNVQELAEAIKNVLKDASFKKSLEDAGLKVYKERFSLGSFFASIAKIHRREFGMSGRSSALEIYLKKELP
jgi:glycosyltransferase involved in cell wall biosynthesis